MVALGVLGPLVLHDARGDVVTVGSLRQRRLLAALATRPNVGVADDELVELTWGATLPVDPVAAVQTVVARLRRALPDSVRVATERGAYRLVIDAAELDTLRFTAQVRTAQQSLGAARIHVLDEALALWRGQPFAELDHLTLSATVARLTEARLAARECRAEALVSVGRATEAIDDLEPMVADEPTRESAVALLVRALCAAGRQHDALRVLARLRRSLVEELGVGPTEPLRRLEEQVLLDEVSTPSPPLVVRRGRPLPRNPLVGRDRELRRVGELFDSCRVVSIVGPGGVGKTRLVRHVVEARRERYADGVIWVELSSSVNAADVPAAIANDLRLTASPGATLLDEVVESLVGRRLLVVLDNCEHLADELAAVVERLAAAETVDVLLTSRVALHVEDEHVVVLAPLTEPDATRLFRDRLAAGAALDAIPPADAGLVGEIIGRLDGLPLVLELAAARVPGLGLHGLRDALHAPFDVLSDGHRSERHRSLLEVVDWSVRLLSEEQRDLFDDMATFVGPVELAAVVRVARSDVQVAGRLADLVDRSLVTLHDGDPPTYGMFEFVRAFGRARLPAGRSAASADRHARWAVDLAESLLAADTTRAQAVTRRRFDIHLPDLRDAHAWLLDHDRVEELIRLTIVLAHHAYHRLLVDLVGLVDETLLAVADVEDPLRVRLLGIAANFGWQRGDLASAEQRSADALLLGERVAAEWATAAAHGAFGTVLMMRGDRAGAGRECERARSLAAADGDHATEALALIDLGLSACYAGDDAVAARHGAALDALAGEVGAPSIRGWAAYLHGERLAERDPPLATRHLTDAVAAAEEVDDRFLAGVARHTLMTTAARMDEAGHGVASFAGLLEQWHRSGAWTQVWLTVRSLIEALSRNGRHREAAVLFGAYASSGTAPAVFGPDKRRLEAAVTAARRDLGDEFDTCWSEGVALDDQRAIALAVALTRPTGDGDQVPSSLPDDAAVAGTAIGDDVGAGEEA